MKIKILKKCVDRLDDNVIRVQLDAMVRFNSDLISDYEIIASGIARCQKGDVYNEEIGVNIAKAKAMRTIRRRVLKFLNWQKNKYLNAIHEIEHEFYNQVYLLEKGCKYLERFYND